MVKSFFRGAGGTDDFLAGTRSTGRIWVRTGPTRLLTKGRDAMQKITPWLWFDTESEEAASFYTSVFKNSRILSTSHYGDAGPRPAGSVMTVAFELDGQEFVALNGGPEFKPNEAISFMVSCESQDEVDEYWDLLTSDGGEASQCGWLKDKFGISWQIIPTELEKLIADPDPERSQRAMAAMLTMGKIDIEAIRKAAAGA
jgi:predicted 3-demethylubiquinone-9 3-methyltransferase (glyoxalase superfamily)